mmetsp:Transcript_151263/g.263630  ORF Transcript_151263/g.263630 Transcript_151263/m.263630 type:complete len:134 (-) Transcript_151263:52-453(-)
MCKVRLAIRTTRKARSKPGVDASHMKLMCTWQCSDIFACRNSTKANCTMQSFPVIRQAWPLIDAGTCSEGLRREELFLVAALRGLITQVKHPTSYSSAPVSFRDTVLKILYILTSEVPERQQVKCVQERPVNF